MKKLLLTDVDGTLTKKSVVLSHAGFLIEKGIIKDNGSYEAWQHDMKNEALIVAVAENYRYEIIGMSEEEMHASQFIHEFYNNKENWYSTLSLLENNYQDYEKALVTGSSDFLIKELAKKLNCTYHATIYKKHNNCFTGEIEGMFSETQKDDYVQWFYDSADYSFIEAWGDTVSDNGLFKHANYKILVDPTQSTLEKLITKQVGINKIIKK